jgi:hypothetical protein
MPYPTQRHPAPDGVVVRLLVAGSGWAESLPPVPSGQDVTVSFSTADAEAEHADAVALLGYRVVGVEALPPRLGTEPAADFLVARTVLEAHPAWWAALAAQAHRTFNLALGPVAAVLGPILSRHVQPLR